ncbi:MAG: hypothetical protein M3N49_10985 [Candidatus Eremiobacteraeota bacterium]|nr:hypothetical protein [Candidatus Eremiobacteraeota bacterium]
MRFFTAFAALICAAASLLPPTAGAAGEPRPTIPVPAGWTQTHTSDRDTTWKRDNEQLHVKRFAFTGSADDVIEIVVKGMKAEETEYTLPVVTPVTVCGGTLAARRAVFNAGAGADRVAAEMIAVTDGKVAYAATYLRLASDPDRAEAHAALLGLCITK